MKPYLIIACLLLAGCGSHPVCYVTRTLGVKITGGVQPVDIPSQTVTVCVTPPSIDLRPDQ